MDKKKTIMANVKFGQNVGDQFENWIFILKFNQNSVIEKKQIEIGYSFWNLIKVQWPAGFNTR